MVNQVHDKIDSNKTSLKLYISTGSESNRHWKTFRLLVTAFKI
jgi:hypothetical protein